MTRAIERFFEADGWVVDRDDSGVWNFAVRGTNGEWYGQAWWIEPADQLLVYSIAPMPIPEECREETALLLNRMNAQLVVAAFELDLADGELRCRTALSVHPDRLDPDLVARVVYANVHAMDRYLPAIVRVTAGADPRTVDLAP